MPLPEQIWSLYLRDQCSECYPALGTLLRHTILALQRNGVARKDALKDNPSGVNNVKTLVDGGYLPLGDVEAARPAAGGGDYNNVGLGGLLEDGFSVSATRPGGSSFDCCSSSRINPGKILNNVKITH